MARTKNKIAPDDERAVVAMDKQQEAIEKATELYGDGQPFEEQRVLDCIVFKAERTSQELYELGKYCLWYKAAVGHGRFLEGLQQRDINVTAANWAMLMVEKFGDKFCTVQNLGTRKARLLTAFTKEEIDTFSNGGDLAGIPHDDVFKMTTAELGEEIKKTRQKLERQKAAHKKEVEKLNEIIDDLKIRAEDPMQLTPAQKAERQLRTLTAEYSIALAKISAGFREAMSILNEGEKIPGIGVQELNAWLNEFVPDSVTIHDLLDQWQAGFENPCPVVDNFFDIIEGKTGV
ncbi:MAG: hypothetical protein LBK62_00535 [Treponema sp.]|jgi:hypothetical protein|nr:hypothetical protein [Treponema sp.]